MRKGVIYAYFQMLYNLGTLFESAGIPSSDRVSPLKNATLCKSTTNLLPTVLYIGHSAFELNPIKRPRFWNKSRLLEFI
jgi:hypothetical protein